MITLRKVDDTNVRDVLALEVRDDQQYFVTNARDSMEEHRAIISHGEWSEPIAVYDDDCPVGFAFITYERSDSTEPPGAAPGYYVISHYYIDKRYQHRGYGRSGLLLCLDYLRTAPCGKADSVWIAWNPANPVAGHLYESVGFEHTDLRNGEEIVSVLRFDVK